jgi:peroxiredoxin Q/BCP
LRGFEKRLPDFRARGVAVFGISVDSCEDSRQLCQSQGYTFPLLSDPRAEVVRHYGVLHARAGLNDQDIARPAEFLVDASGTIRWVNLTEDIRVRARPENVLRAIDTLMPAAVSNR